MKPKIFPERRRGRVAVSLSARSQMKLKQMAISCNKKPARMGQLFIDFCLNSPSIIRKFQEEYNTNPSYWCRTSSGINGDYVNHSYLVGYQKPSPVTEAPQEMIVDDSGPLVRLIPKP